MQNSGSTVFRVDALLVGCILAFVLQHESIRNYLQRNSSWIFLACLPIFFFCVYRFQVLIPLTESLVVAIMIACTCLSPSSRFATALEQRHLKLLGMASYSVYVWQELFLLPHWGLIGICLLVPVSLGSYLLIERNGIAIGHKLQHRLRHEREYRNASSMPADAI